MVYQQSRNITTTGRHGTKSSRRTELKNERISLISDKPISPSPSSHVSSETITKNSSQVDEDEGDTSSSSAERQQTKNVQPPVSVVANDKPVLRRNEPPRRPVSSRPIKECPPITTHEETRSDDTNGNDISTSSSIETTSEQM
jgi:hypothetical protein